MIKFLIIILFIFSLINLFAINQIPDKKQDFVYYSIKVLNDNKDIFKKLYENGFDCESINLCDDGYFELIVNSDEIHLLDSFGIKYSILIEDMESFLENQLKHNYSKKQYILGDDFFLGSMAGFYTYDETIAFFNNLIKKYDVYFREVDTIGYSIENRPILCYSFSSSTKNVKDEILFTSLHHSREPSGLMVLCYFLHTLLKRAAEGEKNSIYLLDHNLIHIVPFVNPDGYIYNQKIKPDGGGLWRKNRRLNLDSTWGVDLNRNYGDFEFWNSSNMGSSTNPANETYRGTKPFSEPETQAVRDFCLNHNIKIALNYHSFGNYLIYPYSATMNETPDSLIFRAFSMWVSKNNEILFGRDFNTVGYYGRGTSDDWMYKSIPEKDRIISFTVEVGRHQDGFWPLYPERIFQQCVEFLNLNYEVLWSSEANIRPISIKANYNKGTKDCNLNLIVQNIGIKEQKSNCNLTIKAINNFVNFDDSIKILNFLKPAETKLLTFKIPFPKRGFVNGSIVPFVIKIEFNDIVRYDTLFTSLWYPQELLLYSTGEADARWNLGNWGLEYDLSSNNFVFSDSPQSLYGDSISNFLTWQEPISLECNNAYLEFDTRWQIEGRYDFGIVQISTDGGDNWEYLKSDRMVLGSGINKSRQPDKTYGFAGFYPDWVEQSISLSEYIGKKVMFRFGLLSDQAKHFDGWFLKNIRLMLYNELDWTTIQGSFTQKDKFIIPHYIKGNDFIKIDIEDEFDSFISVRIYNLLGQLIFDNKYENTKHIIINEKFNTGIYLLELIINDKSVKDKLIITE